MTRSVGSTFPLAGHWPPPATEWEINAVRLALVDGSISRGVWTGRVEEQMRAITGSQYAIAYSTCTAAIHACLIASNIGPDSGVLLPALTFTGTWTGGRHLRATPVWSDVIEEDLTLGGYPLTAARGWEATVAVDLHGAPHRQYRFDPRIITDACQSLGTTEDGVHLGRLGTHCWSFGPAKLIGAPGGACVTTQHPGFAGRVHALRDYGLTGPGERANRKLVEPLGHNWRPSELDMLIVAHRLPRIADIARRAHDIGEELRQAAQQAGYGVQTPARGAAPAWHKIRVQAADTAGRDALNASLARQGIGTHRWGRPLHLDDDGPPVSLPITERAWESHTCLGTEQAPHWTWTVDEIRRAKLAITTAGERQHD